MFQKRSENRQAADFFASDDTPLSITEVGATMIVPQLAAFESDAPLIQARLLIQLFVRMGNVVQQLALSPSERFVLGRVSPNIPHNPNVDLTSFNALQLGVSRFHAVIENHGNVFTLTDLYSSNGTQLNGRRLAPNEIRFLYDGDTICLGKLVLYVGISELSDD